MLSEENQWECEDCGVRKDAIKKINLTNLPSILILQLKRFSFQDNKSIKISDIVDFPLDNLNLNECIYNNLEKNFPSYRLFAITNHIGESLQEGHYTSFCHDSKK